jgi:hypothetical protein
MRIILKIQIYLINYKIVSNKNKVKININIKNLKKKNINN